LTLVPIAPKSEAESMSLPQVAGNEGAGVVEAHRAHLLQVRYRRSAHRSFASAGGTESRGAARTGPLYYPRLVRSAEVGLGEAALGVFCNGEISHDRLYGYTGVPAVFN
jgi:hypothetical protein